MEKMSWFDLEIGKVENSKLDSQLIFHMVAVTLPVVPRIC